MITTNNPELISAALNLTIEDKNIAYLNGDIDDSSAEYIVRFILEKKYQETKPNHLKLIINSDGGNVHQAFAIIDVMKSVPFPIYTYGLGSVSSSGLFIFMSGTKGHRYLFRNAVLMTHQYTTQFSGKENDIKSWNNYCNITSKNIIEIYQDGTGLEEKVIKKKFLSSSDLFITPSQAVSFGFADKIIDKF